MTTRTKVTLTVGGILLLLGIFAWHRADRLPRLPRITLKDGRIVELAGITLGESHTLGSGWRGKLNPFLPSSLKRLAGPHFQSTFGFGHPGLAVWLMCYDPAADAYQSGWINTCHAVDEHGCEFPAQNFGSTGDGYYFAQIASFPAYPRRQASFICRIYDMNSKAIADVPIAIQAAPPAPVWEPETLPAWSTNGPLALRLDRFAARSQPQFEILRGVVPEKFWATDKSFFEDATGNAGELLCREEKAWRWKAIFHRTAEAPFAPGELITLTNVSVPAPGVFVTFPVNASIGGTAITNLSVAGPGRYDFSNGVLIAQLSWTRGMERSHGSSSSGGSGNVTTRIWKSSDCPLLILPEIEIPPRAKLLVLLREQQEILGTATASGSANKMHFYELPQATPVGPVNLDFIVDPGFEFSVKVSPADAVGPRK